MTPEDLAVLYPEATICGATVLHRAGWSTQIPSRINVAVDQSRMPLDVDGFRVVGRPGAWFVPTTEELHGIRALTPIESLVDAWAHDDQWRPPPDDLEDDTPWEEMRAAFEAADVPWPEVYATWEPEKYVGGRRIAKY